jgi:hypothetical protein
VRIQLIRTTVVRVVVPFALLGLALTACTGETGDPTPATTTTRTAGDTGTTTTSAPEGPSLADFKPCPTLTEVGSQFNLTEITEDGTDSCEAEYSDSVSVRLDVHADKSLADYVPGPEAQQSDTSIGGREAKLVQKAFTSSSCVVAIAVGDSSRVDVFASADASLDEACEAATKVATAVEPKLPK